MHPIKRILLPIDDSPGGEEAVAYAALLARALGASVTVAHVDETPSPMVAIVPGATVEGDIAIENAHSRERLDQIAAQLTASGVAPVHTLAMTAASIVVALVDQAPAFDLIVMATHARKGVSRLLLGSIAEQVLRHATCPVLTVHLPEIS